MGVRVQLPKGGPRTRAGLLECLSRLFEAVARCRDVDVSRRGTVCCNLARVMLDCFDATDSAAEIHRLWTQGAELQEKVQALLDRQSLH